MSVRDKGHSVGRDSRRAGMLLTVLLAFLFHASLVPFAESGLVLCVGPQGHVAVEFSPSAQSGVPAVAPFVLDASQQSSHEHTSCQDLGLARLNRPDAPRLAKTVPGPESLSNAEPATLDLSARASVVSELVSQTVVRFPAFLKTSVLLI